MSHSALAHLEEAPRNELHDLLHLTAAEISRNTLPAGVSVPFVHRHRKNEEIYLGSTAGARCTSTAKNCP